MTLKGAELMETGAGRPGKGVVRTRAGLLRPTPEDPDWEATGRDRGLAKWAWPLRCGLGAGPIGTWGPAGRRKGLGTRAWGCVIHI